MAKCPFGEYCVDCNPPEPTSPSVEALAQENQELKLELILRNQDIEDLRLTNRNLSRKIVEDARKRGEAATQQPNWLRGIHGS